MKNKLLLNTIRDIKKAPGRFAAITAIIAISCAFYSGIKASCPDMKNSAAEYYSDYALADIQIKSTLGFNEGDSEKLLNESQFDKAYQGYSADLFTDSGSGQAALKVMSFSDDYPLNHVMLVEGRLPEKPDECLADAQSRSKIDFSVGQKITLTAPEGDDIEDTLDVTEFTVVGLVRSPLYISFDRGSTTVGNGSLDAFVYIPEESFSMDVYTDIYLSVAGTENINPFTDEYESIVAAAEERAEELSVDFLAARAEDIRAQADEELEDARKKLETGEKELADGKKEYEKGQKEVSDAQEELNAQRADFDDALQQYNEGAEELDEKEKEMNNLSQTCVKIDKFLTDYENVYMKVLPDPLLSVFKEIQEIYDQNSIDAAIEDLMAVYIITDPEKDPVVKETARANISAVNEQVRQASDSALYQIAVQKDVLAQTKEQLDAGEQEFEQYEKELDDAQNKLEEAQKELTEAQAKIDDANAEIADAQQEVEDTIADGEWYVWNRDEWDPDCASYGQDAERVDSIAAVFPVFFILIAALVCITTMSRMVEEQRVQTGTLKALGYSSGSIIAQYVLYAVMASVIGSIIGSVIGLPLLPTVIYKCYQTMYQYPYFNAPIIPGYVAGCMAASVACTVFSALFTSVKELSGAPAALIRPKPPKNGKRILLERITPLWNRMKFIHKVTFRNLMRYKSRFLMTVIGIGGCTALLLTAFGLKESIACIVDKQYDELFLYDIVTVVSDTAEQEDIDEVYSVLNSRQEVTESTSVIQQSKNVTGPAGTRECSIFAPDSIDDFSDYIVLRDRQTGTPIDLKSCGSDGKAVINEKLANMLGVGVGDSITVEGGAFPLTVSAITENYAFHYVYLTRDNFNALMGDSPSNMIISNTTGTPEKSVREEISAQLISCNGVISSVFSYDGADNFRKLVKSLNLIVVVLIAFAGALSFVILYNLANININERVRELATIKVLGFFDGEVGAYIYRENTISAVVGMAAGLVFGIFFERFVIKTAEVDEVMFSPDIPPMCFILAAVTMLIFLIIVNLILYFKLKRIDMASSMKAIE